MWKMIVAVDKENGIGKNNYLPWHLPVDLRRFSKLTKGHGNNAIVMGRKTYESIGRPLPDRANIVLSSTMKSDNKDIIVCESKVEVLKTCHDNNYDEVWVIGGSSIYSLFFKSINELFVTEIDSVFDCDSFFITEYQDAFQECINQGECNDKGIKFFYKKYFSNPDIQNA